MKLFGKDSDGTFRVLGVPASLDGVTSREARLGWFEPENPNLFVPRKIGVGWDLNVGALAVKLGLIRPDDSLPDLESYISDEDALGLTLAPLIGAATVTCAVAVASAKRDEVVSNWSLTLRPKELKTPLRAFIPNLVLSNGFAAWNAWQNRKGGVDVVGVAETLGIQAFSLLNIVAAVKSADRGDRPCPGAVLATLAMPAVTTGVLVATVKSALKNVERDLQNQ